MTNKIDHIAVGATSLERGQTELKQTLGVEIPKGGKHEFMATHNCVAQVGNSSFIEILAIDPEGKAITHPRWFTLDEPGTQARLAKASAPCAGWSVLMIWTGSSPAAPLTLVRSKPSPGENAPGV